MHVPAFAHLSKTLPQSIKETNLNVLPACMHSHLPVASWDQRVGLDLCLGACMSDQLDNRVRGAHDGAHRPKCHHREVQSILPPASSRRRWFSSTLRMHLLRRQPGKCAALRLTAAAAATRQLRRAWYREKREQLLAKAAV